MKKETSLQILDIIKKIEEIKGTWTLIKLLMGAQIEAKTLKYVWQY